MAKRLKTQIFQFSLIGISNAVVDIGSLNLFLWVWPTQAAGLLLTFNTLAYTLAILNSYFWNTIYTFKHAANKNRTEFSLFIAQAVIALLISNVTFIGAIQLFQQFPFQTPSNFVMQNTAKILAMFTSSSFSFIIMKFFLFKDKPKS